MSKSRRTETSRKAERQENPLLEAVVAARSDLRALVMDAGFGVLGSLLEEDRAELCGERYARSQQRRAYRHGYDEGSLVMGGRRVKVRKPRARSVDGQELPLLVIDGTHMGKHLLVIAMGIDADGVKHVLGVVEGTTESSHVCRSLLRQLIERGMPVERARLVVIDGSKGLRKAVRDTFGEWALIQRCRVHKIKNVLEHLPGHIRPWFAAKIRKAWKAETATAATKQLDAVVKELETDHPGAAASLREGMQETLTVTRLRVQGPLLRTLRSTNTIENLNGTIKHVSRNVKRWRSGSMIVRWAVTALIEAESKFRRVRGYRDIAKLDAALNTAVDVPLEQERRTA